MSNLPDDVSPSDIDKHFGGSEETFHLQARISVSIPQSANPDANLQEKLNDRIDSKISLKDYNILSQETTIEDEDDSTVYGSVVIEFPYTTINKQDYQDFALQELQSHLDDSDEDIQFLEFV